MAALTEPNQVGKREDLSDVIANVDAHETPFTSMAPKGKPLTNAAFSYQADKFDAPNTAGVVDGADVSTFNNKAKNRKLISARCQKWREPYQVSDMAENLSDVAGLRSEFANAKAKAIVELKRSMEATFCSDKDSQDDDGTNAYQTRGLGVWIQNGAQGHEPVAEDYRTPAASINSTAMASLTETLVNDVLESIWGQTGGVKRFPFLVGSKLKRRISDFATVQEGVSSTIAAVRSFNINASEKTVMRTVDVYQGDFGTLDIMLSNYLAYDANGATAGSTRRGYVLAPNRYKIRMLRNPGAFDLEDQGGGPRGYVDAIGALCVENPLGFGAFKATS